jgi:magnesium chelatase family protein
MTRHGNAAARRCRFSDMWAGSPDRCSTASTVRFRELTGETPPDAEDSAVIRRRVISARERQRQRLEGDGIFSNAAMTPRLIRKFCRIDSESEVMLERAMNRLGLSARAYDRILKVSRTIADLEGVAEIQSSHVSEAVHYRSLDRTYWT